MKTPETESFYRLFFFKINNGILEIMFWYKSDADPTHKNSTSRGKLCELVNITWLLP